MCLNCVSLELSTWGGEREREGVGFWGLGLRA